MREIARAEYDEAVLAEISGQTMHASQLTRTPLLTLTALDIAAHELARVRPALRHADHLSVPNLIVAPGGRPGGRPQLRALIDLARDTDRTLAVMPRVGSAVWNIETALRLVERAPKLRLWPDTSHLGRAGEQLPSAARALAPYCAGWFVRDHDGTSTGPGSFETQVPGKGRLDLSGTLRGLHDAGFDGPVVFHAVGHLPGGVPRPEYPLERLRALACEARDYLGRYATNSSAWPT